MATPIQLAAAFTALASRANHGSITAAINGGGIDFKVTDPAIQHDIITAYELRRDHSFPGVYTGTVRGVPVSVAAAPAAITAPTQRKAS